MRPSIAEMIMEDRTTRGVKWNNGVSNNNVTITANAMTMFDTAVLHPALKFTADRENGPTT